MFTINGVWILGQLMQEIAQATFTYEQFPEVMGMLWKRMLGERKNWRRTYKVSSVFSKQSFLLFNKDFIYSVTFVAQLPD